MTGWRVVAGWALLVFALVVAIPALATEQAPNGELAGYDGASDHVHRYDDAANLKLPSNGAKDAPTHTTAIARKYDADVTVAASRSAARGASTTSLRPACDASGLSVAPSGQLSAPGATSRLVPGGGLAAHEAAGGHAMARHLGMTDADLLARLSAQPNISGASTFGTRAVAEASTARLLDANQTAIRAWLQSGAKGPLVLNSSGGGVTGRFVAQGTSQVMDVSGVRAVLRADPSLGLGYRIQTAYPVPVP